MATPHRVSGRAEGGDNQVIESPWMDAIEEFTGILADEVPAGWLTTEEIADSCGRTTQHTSDTLRKMIANGRAERRKYRINRGGVLRAMYHYRLVKE